jgi:hypothetical protein
MKNRVRLVSGLAIILLGLFAIGFCEEIVVDGLARVVGIEAIVGKENVIYRPDGSYYFTNPRAVVEWSASVLLSGILIVLIGIWISGIRLKFPVKKRPDAKIR